MFRLGRLRSGGAKGPGLFFVMPCVDSYKKVDLRTVSFDVPPQEVSEASIMRMGFTCCIRCLRGSDCTEAFSLHTKTIKGKYL